MSSWFDRAWTVVWAVTIGLNVMIGIANIAGGEWTLAMNELAFVAVWAMFPWFRRTWKRIGAREARWAMHQSLDEAVRRGLTPIQWWRAEIERDVGDGWLRAHYRER